MGDMFHRLAPYIQDYIYASNWTELREIQVAACHAVFDTDENLLLSSGTASGKTEAAFLPVLTELYHHPSSSVGVLYILSSGEESAFEASGGNFADYTRIAGIPAHP